MPKVMKAFVRALLCGLFSFTTVMVLTLVRAKTFDPQWTRWEEAGIVTAGTILTMLSIYAFSPDRPAPPDDAEDILLGRKKADREQALKDLDYREPKS